MVNESSKVTTEHDEIKAWVEKHNGKPQFIHKPQQGEDHVGLRIDFPGEGDDTFLSDDNPPQDVTWEEWFDEFENQDLAFDYDEHLDPVDPGLSYRFVPRENLT